MYDMNAAMSEGWLVSQVDSGVRKDGTPWMEIQKHDEDPADTFKCDESAWAHVVCRARGGSALHIAALNMVDPTERKLIVLACGEWDATKMEALVS
jgi:hypothetical protein